MGESSNSLSGLLFERAVALGHLLIDVVGGPDEAASATATNAAPKSHVVVMAAKIHEDGSGLRSIPAGYDGQECTVVRMRAGADLAESVRAVSAMLSDAPRVRVFIFPEQEREFGDEADAGWSNPAPSDVAEVEQFLSDAGYRLFRLDDEQRRWFTVAPADWPAEEGGAHTGPTVLYAVKDPGMLALAAAIHSTGLGGAERAHVDLVEGLVRRGHLMHTFIPLPSGPIVDALAAVGGSVSQVFESPWLVGRTEHDASWSGAALGTEDFVVKTAAIRPDAMITQTGVLAAPSIAAQLLRLPHLWYLHERQDPGHGIHPWFPDPRSFGDEVLRRSSAVVTSSGFVSNWFFAEPVARILAPMAYRGPTPTPVPADPPAGTWALGVIAQLNPAKGQDVAVEALRIIRDQGVDACLKLVGPGSLEEQQRLTALADRHGVTDRVELAGFVEDPASVFEACDIILSPSKGEGFGRVPIEAIRAGRPVIYADSGGVSEYMLDGISGLAVPPGDAGALADAVLRIVRNDDLRRRIVQMAPEVVDQWLADHDLVEGFEELARAAVAAADHPGSWGDAATREMATTWCREQLRAHVEAGTLRSDLDTTRSELHKSQVKLAETQVKLGEAEQWLSAVRESRWFRLGNTIRHPMASRR